MSGENVAQKREYEVYLIFFKNCRNNSEGTLIFDFTDFIDFTDFTDFIDFRLNHTNPQTQSCFRSDPGI